MNYEAIRNEVQNIFREVADEPSVILKDETTADDVEGWDSLVHIQLLVAIESKFNISFSSEEIGGYNNIGAMCIGIQQKLSS